MLKPENIQVGAMVRILDNAPETFRCLTGHIVRTIGRAIVVRVLYIDEQLREHFFYPEELELCSVDEATKFHEQEKDRRAREAHADKYM